MLASKPVPVRVREEAEVVVMGGEQPVQEAGVMGTGVSQSEPWYPEVQEDGRQEPSPEEPSKQTPLTQAQGMLQSEPAKEDTQEQTNGADTEQVPWPETQAGKHPAGVVAEAEAGADEPRLLDASREKEYDSWEVRLLTTYSEAGAEMNTSKTESKEEEDVGVVVRVYEVSGEGVGGGGDQVRVIWRGESGVAVREVGESGVLGVETGVGGEGDEGPLALEAMRRR